MRGVCSFHWSANLLDTNCHKSRLRSSPKINDKRNIYGNAIMKSHFLDNCPSFNEKVTFYYKIIHVPGALEIILEKKSSFFLMYENSIMMTHFEHYIQGRGGGHRKKKKN